MSARPGSASLRIVDAVAFAAEQVLPRLSVTRKLDSLALHPTCSSTRMGIDDSLLPSPRPSPTRWTCRTAGAAAASPATAGCCIRS